jgi:hypothetical protein
VTLLPYEEKMARLRSREAGLKRPVQRAARLARLRAERLAEDRRFSDRLRFDQSKVWNWNRPKEPRSIIRSSWPALEDAMHRFGIPGLALWQMGREAAAGPDWKVQYGRKR